MLLVGDVGGTNCRLALWDGGICELRVYPTAAVSSLQQAVARYLAAVGARPDAAAVAVAGPVVGRSARLTNSDWTADLDALPMPAVLLNDLHAAALGIDALGAGQQVRLGGGAPQRGAPLAVIGIGTGLGCALRIGSAVFPGEAGHGDFAPASAQADALLGWLRPRLGRVRVESVLSGPGLGRLLDYARTVHPGGVGRPPGVPAGAVVFSGAGSDPACALALSLFVEGIGAFAGDVALATLCRGGVYLCGGILPRVPALTTDGRLWAAFTNKAPMQQLLSAIPLTVVSDPLLGLRGAAAAAEALL